MLPPHFRPLLSRTAHTVPAQVSARQCPFAGLALAEEAEQSKIKIKDQPKKIDKGERSDLDIQKMMTDQEN